MPGLLGHAFMNYAADGLADGGIQFRGRRRNLMQDG